MNRPRTVAKGTRNEEGKKVVEVSIAGARPGEIHRSSTIDHRRPMTGRQSTPIAAPKVVHTLASTVDQRTKRRCVSQEINKVSIEINLDGSAMFRFSVDV